MSGRPNGRFSGSAKCVSIRLIGFIDMHSGAPVGGVCWREELFPPALLRAVFFHKGFQELSRYWSPAKDANCLLGTRRTQCILGNWIHQAYPRPWPMWFWRDDAGGFRIHSSPDCWNYVFGDRFASLADFRYLRVLFERGSRKTRSDEHRTSRKGQMAEVCIQNSSSWACPRLGASFYGGAWGFDSSRRA